MKNTKKSKARRSSVQENAPLPTAKRLDDLIRELPARRVPREELQRTAAGAVAGLAIDSIVMARVREALASIDTDLLNACIQRKLLPHLSTTLITEARLLASILIPARAAQSITGVPASILIADLWHTSPFDPPNVPEGNDYFETGRKFESIEASFLDRASQFATEKKFQPVMRAVGDPARYLREIGRCELWNELGRSDRVDLVGRLQECDTIPDEAALNRLP